MDKTTLQKIKKELAKHITVEKVYLFGSRARGEAHEDSDYDIAIISKDFENMHFSQKQQLARTTIRKVIGVQPLDVVCYTPEEFERGKQAALSGIIAKEGIAA